MIIHFLQSPQVAGLSLSFIVFFCKATLFTEVWFTANLHIMGAFLGSNYI